MESRLSGWSREEVEAIVADYFDMLSSELSGVAYNKTAHARVLASKLNQRSRQAIEFKHCNISAILFDAGAQSIPGYKPRGNYQALLALVVDEWLQRDKRFHKIAEFDAERPIAVPEVADILGVLRARPVVKPWSRHADSPAMPVVRSPTNYFEREARNRSLGDAGEQFVLAYEQARLISRGHERLAAKIEHTAKVRGDHEGYDILSYEDDGRERLIEVKTTKYGEETPFFVSQNEVRKSSTMFDQYRLYRLYDFQRRPLMYELVGALNTSCVLQPNNFMAFPK